MVYRQCGRQFKGDGKIIYNARKICSIDTFLANFRTKVYYKERYTIFETKKGILYFEQRYTIWYVKSCTKIDLIKYKLLNCDSKIFI